MKNPTYFLSAAVGVWVIITLLLNFVVPHDWFFSYESLIAETEICRDSKQEVTGVRWSLFTTPSRGVDQIYPVGVSIPADRFEWDQGKYLKGTTTSSWFPEINVREGEYYWEASVIELRIFHIFPVFLSSDERPKSNTFKVIVCE